MLNPSLRLLADYTYFVNKYGLNLTKYEEYKKDSPLVLTAKDKDTTANIILREFSRFNEDYIEIIKEINTIFKAIDINELRFFVFLPEKNIFVCKNLLELQEYYFKKCNCQFEKLIFDSNNYSELSWTSADLDRFGILFEIEIIDGEIQTKEIISDESNTRNSQGLTLSEQFKRNHTKSPETSTIEQK